MQYGYGNVIKSASTPSNNCKTFTLEQGDCISAIWTYYGGYVEYMQAKTQKGKYITLAAQQSWQLSGKSASYKADFQGGCLRGQHGTAGSGGVARIGFWYDNENAIKADTEVQKWKNETGQNYNPRFIDP
jgi:hypothetical protein